MDWKRLLNSSRVGAGGRPVELSDRTRFQRDFDRIVFSTAFRRLHGKTQVFPLPRSDVTHTRSSHSLEASCVARSFGAIVDQYLNLPEGNDNACSEILAAAALAHDLGNPPFGHSGEKAIGDYFKSHRAQTVSLTEQERKDLEDFEANALGFRILAHTNPLQSTAAGGMQLTYATLAAFTKYPRHSTSARSATSSKAASEKKWGYFQADQSLFEEVANAVGLIQREPGSWVRHPLAFLLEAADDICYRVIDLEDAYRLDIVPFDATVNLLEPIADSQPARINRGSLRRLNDRDQKIAYLRAKAITNLVQQSARVFKDNLDAILNGTFDSALVDSTPSAPNLDAIKQLAERVIFAYRPVVEIEAAGFEVLGGLLESFVGAALDAKPSARSKKTLSLLPPEVLPPKHLEAQSPYLTMLALAQYVAGMTDEYAITTYRTLRGIALPAS